MKRTLEKPLRDAGKYLTNCESKILRDEMQKEQTRSLTAFSMSASEHSGSASSRRDHYDAHLSAATSKLVHVLLSGGVFVPPDLATKYPWFDINLLFVNSNRDLVTEDGLVQAEARSMVTIVALQKFLPYPERREELRKETTEMWPKTREIIVERRETDEKAFVFHPVALYVQEETFKLYKKIIIVSEYGLNVAVSRPMRLTHCRI